MIRGTRPGTLLAIALAGVAVLAVTPAGASFHDMKISEVFAGSGPNPNAQYVELVMQSDGQNFVQGHPVTIYNAAGTQVGSFPFATSVANGASGSSILVATVEAQTLFGVTADLLMTAVIPRTGGKACFDTVDCATWGNYTGAGPVGTPFSGAEGILPGSSAARTGTDTNNSASDFSFAMPSPRTNGGTTGNVGCAPGFASAATSVAETAGSATITVSGCPSSTVEYSTADGTALAANGDYTPASGTLSFGPFESSKTFSVPVHTDAVSEPTETVALRLRNQSTEFLGRANATLSITNIDPPPMPASAPRNLTATASPGQIALAWQPPLSSGSPPVNGYRIYRGISSGSETLLTSVGNVLSFTDTGLPGNTTRYYKVTALNGAESPPSNEASATTPPVAVPTAPLNPAATATAGRVDVMWAAPANNGGGAVTGYRVYRGPDTGNLSLRASTGPVFGFGDTLVVAGTTYFYAVSAVNSAGEGPMSSIVSVTTPSAPAAPVNVLAQPGSSVGQIRITWDVPPSNGGSPLTNYRIYRSDGGTEIAVATLAASSLRSFTDSGRQPLRSYSYRVSAINAVGEGTKSAGSCTKPFPWHVSLGCPF